MNIITTIEQLEENLSTPTDAVVRTMAAMDGDLMVLGAGGKMGPWLAHMAARAIEQAGAGHRLLAVSRFSDPNVPNMLHAWGIETIHGDLLDPAFIDSLPEVPNLIYMAGRKFGTAGAESMTWATNAYLPGLVGNRFRHSRIVAFSTGNVYRPMPIDGPGSVETDRPDPHGEYGMSCLGRERMFEYFGHAYHIPLAIIRLNYATELRYGVLVDLAEKILRDEEISLTVGHFNVIWQTDANAMALCALRDAQCPPLILNTTGRDLIRCRHVAERLGELMNKRVRLTGVESAEALHSNAQRAFDLYGAPRVSLDEMLVLTADWIVRGGATHGKPTHFEVTDGKY
ncbi:MAG: NAD-dependent epimerase/dehydratase family protein [Pirellulales bacterium]